MLKFASAQDMEACKGTSSHNAYDDTGSTSQNMSEENKTLCCPSSIPVKINDVPLPRRKKRRRKSAYAAMMASAQVKNKCFQMNEVDECMIAPTAEFKKVDKI